MEQQQPVPEPAPAPAPTPSHSVDPHEDAVMKKYDVGPPLTPLAELAEAVFRDWIANGVPYMYQKRHGGKKRTDGSVTVRMHKERRPVEPAEMRMIIEFLTRDNAKPIKAPKAPAEAKPSKPIYRPGKPALTPGVLVDAANGRFLKRNGQ